MLKRPIILALDGLRFIAIFHLVVFHLLAHHRSMKWQDHALAQLPEVALNLILSGPAATGLFFLLGGFIATYVYLDADGKKLRLSPKAFLLRRFWRLWPLHALLLAGMWAWGYNADLWSWFVNLLLLQTLLPWYTSAWNVPAWAASCALILGGVWALVVPMLTRLRAKQLLGLGVGLFSVNLALCWGFLWLLPQLNTADQKLLINLTYYGPWVWIGPYLLGAITALFFISHQRSGSKIPLVKYPDLWLIALILMLLNSQAIPHVYMRHSIFLLVQIPLLLGLAANQGVLAWLCRQPWMVRLGQASFSIFLLHMPLMVVWFAPYKDQEVVPWSMSLGYIAVLLSLAIAVEKALKRFF